jgi:hypothetical protein
MSYCRFSWDDSDVYLYEHVDGFIECSACRFDDPWIVQLNSLDEALAHVAKHRAAGHIVPIGVEDDIRAENPWSVTA